MKQFFLLFAISVAASATVCAQTQNSTKGQHAQVFTYVDQMPKFSGDLNQYLADHLQYPKSAQQQKVEGRVVLRFEIDQRGIVQDVRVVRAAQADLDAEAVRVVKNMPVWQPGRTKGQAVSVYYTLPIEFRLDKARTQSGGKG
ncbi:MAG TPA: energy transducer TonB [Flavipsychrobacter sp.]|nr:energy transducer TonB [Flavipsychrobacter sp.]